MSKIINGLNYIGVDDNGVNEEYIIKKIDIGDWDMDFTGTTAVAHGLTSNERKTINIIDIIVRNDADTTYYKLLAGYDGTTPTGVFNGITSTFINLGRAPLPGFFDSVLFDSTSYNRGWVTFIYKPD